MGSARDTYRVLVADDNRDAGAMLAMMLEHQGFTVRLTDNGRSAFELALDFRPHAGIFDIGMPGLTGYELAAYLRREVWAGDVILIALSGWGQESDRSLAYGAGFTHHLTKPAEFEQVTALLAPGRVRSRRVAGPDEEARAPTWARRAWSALRRRPAGARPN